MFSLSINFGPAGTVWGLLFKTKEAANDAVKNLLSDPQGGVSDDFGQIFIGSQEHINAVLLEDLSESKLGMVERMLHEARTRAAATTQAQHDPALRTAQMSQGPGIITPMGMPAANGRMR